MKESGFQAGLTDVATAPLEISTNFLGFDDFWEPFLGGQGPAPTYVLSLDDTEREKLHDALHERLPIKKNGIIPLSARAWGVRGKV